jgi:ABC-type Mn2+/Zn2+ transport system permease subunit
VSSSRPPHPAALATNWKQVLVVDALVGVAVVVAGLVLAVVWYPLPGGAVGALGATYVWLVWRRARDWRQMRAEAGLD